MPHDVTGRLHREWREVDDCRLLTFSVDASPALAVVHALTEILERKPSLVVSGINFGANLSIEITVSGTVGAALEAAAAGFPALASSIEMDPRYHLTGHAQADYAAATAHTRAVAAAMLRGAMTGTRPHPPADDVWAWNLNVPTDATPETPRRITRLSWRRFLIPTPPDRGNGHGRPGYTCMGDPLLAEPDSDIRALLVDRVVSLTPLSLDMTSRTWQSLNTRSFTD
jgi:5'-nucleotidase